MRIIDFLKNPVQLRDNPFALTKKELVKGIIRWYVYILLGMVLAVVFFVGPLKLLDLMPERKMMQSSGRYIFFLILAGPIIEEVICRLSMRYSRINLTLSILFILIFIGRLYIGWIKAVVVAVFFLIIVFLLFRKETTRIDQALEKFWANHFNLVFYICTLSFGLMHITNFQNVGLQEYLLSSLITAPQIVLGFILGYVRIRYQNGFVMAILLHILLNFGSGMMLLLTSF